MSTSSSRFIRVAILASALALSACATVKHGYAYDDLSTPEQSAGVLLGYYGVPSLLITAVDGREFRMTLAQPHPVKIFVLPGERVVKVRYSGVPSLGGGGIINTPYSDGVVRVKVEAGHTYRFLADGAGSSMNFYVQDMGAEPAN